MRGREAGPEEERDWFVLANFAVDGFSFFRLADGGEFVLTNFGVRGVERGFGQLVCGLGRGFAELVKAVAGFE